MEEFFGLIIIQVTSLSILLIITLQICKEWKYVTLLYAIKQYLKFEWTIKMKQNLILEDQEWETGTGAGFTINYWYLFLTFANKHSAKIKLSDFTYVQSIK
jgi:hypothetical protein